jgi:hypothetical protein
MDTSVLALLELVLVLGSVLGLAVWDLVRLRRDRARENPPTRPLPAQDMPAQDKPDD